MAIDLESANLILDTSEALAIEVLKRAEQVFKSAGAHYDLQGRAAITAALIAVLWDSIKAKTP